MPEISKMTRRELVAYVTGLGVVVADRTQPVTDYRFREIATRARHFGIEILPPKSGVPHMARRRAILKELETKLKPKTRRTSPRKR